MPGEHLDLPALDLGAQQAVEFASSQEQPLGDLVTRFPPVSRWELVKGWISRPHLTLNGSRPIISEWLSW